MSSAVSLMAYVRLAQATFSKLSWLLEGAIERFSNYKLVYQKLTKRWKDVTVVGRRSKLRVMARSIEDLVSRRKMVVGALRKRRGAALIIIGRF